MPKIVVIGASQGGVAALHTLVSTLPADFSAPILVVLHIGASQSLLPSILNDLDGMKAEFARHGEVIEAGRIYVAPPDRHMLVNDSQVELSRGPRENWARPAIDPLFRSAAQAYGPDAIGVVMTGRLNDGTAGLYEIKRQGGVAIVQTPSDAEAQDMPASALENVPVDYCLPVGEMPKLLARLVKEPSPERIPEYQGPHAMDQYEAKMMQPTAQTCPECGGAMREERMGNLTRFRCHIGHVMTAEVLAAAQLERLENDFSSALRLLNERAALCREIADKQEAAGNEEAAESWRRAAEEAGKREKAAKALVDLGWEHPEAEMAEEIAE